MHSLAGALVLGYHGCDVDVAEKLLAGEPFKPSQNDWDWLGPGIYFWESNPKRGYDFAVELAHRGYRHSKIKTPAVVGAVINPGLCLDTSTKAELDIICEAYLAYKQVKEAGGQPLPETSADLLRRNLDCEVLRYVHVLLAVNDAPLADTIRGIFVEGDPVYANSGFRAKTHVQLAVRNPECIKGVFRVQPKYFA